MNCAYGVTPRERAATQKEIKIIGTEEKGNLRPNRKYCKKKKNYIGLMRCKLIKRMALLVEKRLSLITRWREW